MRLCNKCSISQEDDQFRIRIDNRIKKPSGLVYRSNVCLKCEAARQRERTKEYRKTPEGRQKHNKWAKEFHERHRDKRLAYGKRKRQTQAHKDYMKEYRKKNKDKIAAQEKITKERYAEKNKKEISNAYVINKLVQQGYGTKEQVSANAELIELKRVQILNRRIKNIIVKHEKGHNNSPESSI